MTKSLPLLFIALCLLSLAHLFNDDFAHSNTSGGPPGHTGSPGDGRSCATSGCHTGLPVQNQEGLISSNIPTTGYIPGETYTITASISASGISKWGFQISPQKPNGQLVGSLINTTSNETQIVGSGKYITHRAGGTSGIGQRTWTFDWVAPVSGTGDLVFYGAFNASNNMNNSSGDQIILSSLAVSEDLSAGTGEIQGNDQFKVYPIPATTDLFIESRFALSEEALFQLMHISGKKIAETRLLPLQGKYHINLGQIRQLTPGVYIIRLDNGKDRHIDRIIIR